MAPIWSRVTPTAGVKHPIKHFLTCSSDHVIYVLQCPCKYLYVGETTMQCRTRINKHKSTIRTRRGDLPVAKHFMDLGHELKELKFWIVDHILKSRRGGDRQIQMKRRELKWIFCLNTLAPNGLNVGFKVLPNMM